MDNRDSENFIIQIVGQILKTLRLTDPSFNDGQGSYGTTALAFFILAARSMRQEWTWKSSPG